MYQLLKSPLANSSNPIRQRAAKLVLFVGVLLLVAFISFPYPFVPAAQAQTWNLVWSDEFNGTSVSTANWTFETGGGGWGNNELEYYTNGQNASVANGVLTITANRVTGGYSCWYGTCQYTSTRMNTKGKRQFQYGRIEARMQIPMGQGLWPAFWSLGANFPGTPWPASGEIDFMEHVNNEGNTHGYIHWDAGGHASYGGASHAINPAAWNTYMVEWTPSYIRWFVNGTQFREANIANSINSTEEFHRPFFIILNLAVGGNWPGSPNTSTVFPARFLVDYVRVYQQGGTSVPTNTPAGPAPTNPPTGGGTISSSTWYSIINNATNKCVDNAAGGTANGNRIQQWSCNASTFNQHWLIVALGDGYYRIMSRNAQQSAIDINGGPGATGDGAKTHLWQYVGGTNQQWRAESLGNGNWRFIARHSGKCLDIPSSSAADGLQLQQWTCNGTNAQSFRLVAR